MLNDIFRAIALVLVIEGILPFLSPESWRLWMRQASTMSNRFIRTVGFASMLSGVVLLYIINY